MVLRKVTFSGRLFCTLETKNSFRFILIALIYAAIDVVIWLGTGFLLYYVCKNHVMNPYIRGFHCSDETLRLPYRNNSVSTIHLLLVTVGTTPFIIALAEALLFWKASGQNLLFKWIRSVTFIFIRYTFAFTLCISLMELLKNYFGVLRPHFLDVCQPEWDKLECATNPQAFIEDPLCSGDASKVLKSRRSFPSGHSAASAFYAVFITLYLIRTPLQSIIGTIFKATMCLATIGWTLFVLVTRVTDGRHHFPDVVAGSLLGLIMASAILPISMRADHLEERGLECKKPVKEE